MIGITRFPIAPFAVLLMLLLSINARGDDIGEAFAQAQRIGAQRWNVSTVTLQSVEGENVAAGTDGNVLVGRNFATRFTRAMTPTNRALALEFVMLHEMVHVAQKKDMPDTSPADPARKPFECQADMLASMAILDSMFEDKSENPEKGPKAVLSTARLLKQVGAGEEPSLPVSANESGHLNKRERALAVHFGFLRALLKWLNTSGQQGDRVEKLRATTLRLLGPKNSEDEYDWSLGLCNAITRSTKDAVDAISLNTTFDLNNDVKTADFDKSENLVFTNNTSRTLIVQLIALTGGYPKESPEKYEDYIFTDASYGSVEIAPHSKGKISTGYNFSSLDSERYTPIFWDYPFDKNTLISASYTGSEVPDPNCNSGWKNLGSSEIEQMAAAMVKIGLASKDGFASILAAPVTPGLDIAAYYSTTKVPGAKEVIIYHKSSNPFTSAELYDGDDFKQATRLFEQTAEAFKKLCSTEGVKFSSKDTADGSSRRLQVANLTGYTEADLILHTRVYTEKSGNITKTYQVSWNIYAKD
ncbi:hypothetical protein GV819_30615 [Pseudomonas sp. Fl5BN2]|uniref:hypothetical protein n=1 Tax=Pseudomonas sp. Fl5BN2 TaxID=2697652 RepID=UPI0013788476|nr:hypothetical protein [Pseudomonas sp. Fl5BN2]NBF06628.1 hypothetical protein [Pseudomonas sp. Fl5BN2]